MEEEEAGEPPICADCGEPTELDSSLSFATSDGKVLCFNCAIRRGGKYDDERDRWEVAFDGASPLRSSH